MAAEARAKITYERLINHTDDVGSKDALKFLMSREIAHLKVFGRALESLGLGNYKISKLKLTPEHVEPYFDDTTGQGDLGEYLRGPWNEVDDVKVVDNPAWEELKSR